MWFMLRHKLVILMGISVPILLKFTLSFPLEEFLDTNDLDILTDYKTNMVCGPTFTPRSQCCSCTPDCQAYDNCCVDYLWYRENGNFSSMRAYQDYLINEKKRSSMNMVCSPIITRLLFSGYGSKSYKLVVKCPEDTDEALRHNCESHIEKLEQSLIVLGNNGNAYSNAYCASCHHVKEYELVQYQIECEKDRIDQDFCMMGLTASHPITMCEPYINACVPETRLYHLCQSFLGPVGYHYNYFCSKCGDDRRKGTSINICYNWDWWHGAKASSNFSTQLRATSRSDDICLTESFQDILLKYCTKILCIKDYKEVKGRCSRLDTRTNNIGIDEERFDSRLIKQMEEIKLEVNDVKKINNSYLYDYLGLKSDDLLLNSTEKNTLLFKLNSLQSKMRSNILNNAYEVIHELSPATSIIITTLKNDLSSVFQLKNIFSNGRLCIDPLPLRGDLQLTSTCEIGFIKIYKRKFNNFIYWVEIKKHSITRYLYKCTHFLPKCRHKTLNANLTIMVNNTLVYTKNGITKEYEYGSYIALKNGDYVICIVEPTSNPLWYSSILTFKKYTLVIGSFASCTSYIIFMTSYYVIKELRNMTTFCLLIKCIYLFVRDGFYFILFFVQAQRKEFAKDICGVINFGTYFCFLSEKIWSVIMMTKIITYKKKSVIAGSTFSSFVFTLLFSFLDKIEVPGGTLKKSHLCGVNSLLIVLIFYMTPISISFVCLAACFIATFLKGSIPLDDEMKKVTVNGFKVVFLCSISEALVFFNVSHPVSMETLLSNAVFHVLYALVKGFRGMLMLIILKNYIFMKYQQQRIKQKKDNSGSEMNRVD